MQEFSHNYHFVNKAKPIFAVEQNFPFSEEFNLKQKQKLKRTPEQLREEFLNFLSQPEQKGLNKKV